MSAPGYAETWGGRIRSALGVVDVGTSVRTEELLHAEEVTHRDAYKNRPPERVDPWLAAEAAANQEQFRIPPPVSAYELAARLNTQDPLARVGIAPEPPSTGFAMRTFVNGQAVYVGDPDAIAKMRASFEADARRRAAAQGRLDATAHATTPYNIYGSVA